MPDKLLAPPHLLKGQSVGIIALSSPCEPVLFKQGVDYLGSLGLKPRIALDPVCNYGSKKFLFSSESAKSRARALEDLFVDPDVGAIVAARGAYGSMEVLPELNYELIARHPKILVGFSDVTAVLCSLYRHSSTPAVHGPSICSAFSNALKDTNAQNSAQALAELLLSGRTTHWEQVNLKLIQGEGGTSGPVIGGNLSVLCSLIGTKWEPDYADHVLFLEETGEKPYRIHRMLLQLKLSGRLNKLRGVLLGTFSGCEHPKGLGPSLDDVVRDIFGNTNLPVAGFFPGGHEALNLPLPMGAWVTIGDGKFKLELPAV